MSMFSTLLRGPKGHPAHPPLTDATIGAFTVATILAVIGLFGGIEDAAGKAMWLALVIGLAVAAATVVTGWADYFQISSGTPLKRTALIHGLSNATANVFFLVAAILQYEGYRDGEVLALPAILTIVGFGFLTVGGWLGGTIVYVHGMRVLNLVDEPTRRAVTPGHPDREQTGGS